MPIGSMMPATILKPRTFVMFVLTVLAGAFYAQSPSDLKTLAREGLAKLDGLIAGRSFIAGERLTLADIVLYAFLDFGNGVGQKLDPANRNLATWFARMAARPSAAASAQPGS